MSLSVLSYVCGYSRALDLMKAPTSWPSLSVLFLIQGEMLSGYPATSPSLAYKPYPKYVSGQPLAFIEKVISGRFNCVSTISLR